MAEKSLRIYLRNRTGMMFLILSVVGCVCAMTAAIKFQRDVSIKATVDSDRRPLTDILHQIFYPIFVKRSNRFQDLFCGVLDGLVYFLFVFLVVVGLSCATIPADKFFAHFLNNLSIIHLVRCVCFSVTVLPQCDFRPKRRTEGQTSFQEFVNLLTLKSIQFGHKNDLLFSGHSAFYCLFCLTIYHFTILGSVTKFCLLLLCLASSFALVCSKKHYTVDVVFAWITTTFIFQNYWHLIS